MYAVVESRNELLPPIAFFGHDLRLIIECSSVQVGTVRTGPEESENARRDRHTFQTRLSFFDNNDDS